ncbi:hypothetical protein BCR39DRAFT_92165 [Naematelia encephala]|uniref:Uncharacterized protein n=1 Tax=Naematelia encephala TaxID=71784 RepID=A0A1Y2B9B5_9TREE|nr:hypothetical protein BCR39DRAFT_92165 [Naematelia encephala]
MSYSSYQNQHLQPAWDNAPPMPAQNLPRHPGGQFPPRFPHDYHPRAPPRSSFQFDPRFQPSTSVPNPSVRSDDIKVLVEEDDGGWERGYPAHQQVHPSKQSPNQMTKPVHQMPPDDVHHDHAHPLEHSKTDERNARLDKVKQSVPMDHDMENSQSSHFESAVNQNSKVVESQHSDFIQASQAVDHAPESPASAATQDPQNTPSSINVSASSTRVDSANLSSPHANLASDSHDKTTMPNGSNTYRQSPLVEVPTWRGPVPGSFQRAIAEVDCDSNRVVVPHPRQWGASSLPQAASVSQNPIGGDHRSENHVVDSITSPASRQGDWDHNARLQNWADSVQTLSPPEAVDPPSTVLRTPSPPDRPDSVPLAPRPVTAYVSEDEESIPLDPGSQTKDDDQSPKSPAVLSVSAEVNGQEITLDKEVDEQSPERTGVLRRNRFERNSSIRSSSQFHAHRGGAFRGPRQNRLADDRGAYYKRPPHPIYHPKFADRRLLIPLLNPQ